MLVYTFIYEQVWLILFSIEILWMQYKLQPKGQTIFFVVLVVVNLG